MVAEDGFVWFKTKKDNLYGAVDPQGNTIVPIEFSEITYLTNETLGFHYFRVSKKTQKGYNYGTDVGSAGQHVL